MSVLGSTPRNWAGMAPERFQRQRAEPLDGLDRSRPSIRAVVEII
jgi:hypothetical protein